MLDGITCYLEKILRIFWEFLENMCVGWLVILKEVVRENFIGKVTFEHSTEESVGRKLCGHLQEEHSKQKEQYL